MVQGNLCSEKSRMEQLVGFNCVSLHTGISGEGVTLILRSKM